MGDVDFTFDDIPNAPLFSTSFVIITAWNPENTTLSELENIQNNQRLEKVLESMGKDFVPALGYLDKHSEESYCVFKLDLQQALDLGKRFHQFSIFYYGCDFLGYYEVATSQPILERTL